MSITLIIGSMYAGKSTTLLTYEKKFKACNKNYILINHSFDKRYSNEAKISTHDGIKGEGKTLTCQKLVDIEIEYLESLEEADCFIIDEAQFFNDIDIFCDKWAYLGKNIVVAGLSGDFKQEEFKSISKLIPLADKIIHIVSNCSVCGSDAPFTKRLSSQQDEIVIGGSELYEPRCRQCLNL